MKIYEFGDRTNPVLMLFPGTFCHWKSNFGHVTELLQKKFFTVCVSYDGFDETDDTEFKSVISQVEQAELYIEKNFGGKIHAAYGCSLGGSLVSLIVSRQRVKIRCAVIGSSDFDQSGKIAAAIKTSLIVQLLYPLIHNGRFQSRLLQNAWKRRMKDTGEYGRAFLSLLDGMSFVKKESMKNLFFSDLVTPVPENIDVPETEVHILYALEMGKKYLRRYQRHFLHPIIHEQALRHEELLVVYPKQWTDLIMKICGV